MIVFKLFLSVPLLRSSTISISIYVKRSRSLSPISNVLSIPMSLSRLFILQTKNSLSLILICSWWATKHGAQATLSKKKTSFFSHIKTRRDKSRLKVAHGCVTFPTNLSFNDISFCTRISSPNTRSRKNPIDFYLLHCVTYRIKDERDFLRVRNGFNFSPTHRMKNSLI